MSCCTPISVTDEAFESVGPLSQRCVDVSLIFTIADGHEVDLGVLVGYVSE
jgi:hypothetical protein